MNKANLMFIAVVLLLTPSIGICESEGWGLNLKGYLGYKDLDDNDWKPVDGQGEIGLLLDFGPKKWPVNIAIDYLDSGRYEYQDIPNRLVRVDGSTREINIGIRKILEISQFVRPYVGGGVAYIQGKIETSETLINQGVTITSGDSDDGIGYWINSGLIWLFNTGPYWFLAKQGSVGIDLRYSKAKITLFGSDVDAGGFHAGLVIGAHW